MAIRYVCSGCGVLLAVYEPFSQDTLKYAGIPPARRLYSMLGGRCPICGKPFSTTPEVRLRPLASAGGDGGLVHGDG